MRAVQRQYPNCRCVVYTGDKGFSGEEILRKAKKSFNVQPIKPVEFVFLGRRQWVEASRYPVWVAVLDFMWKEEAVRNIKRVGRGGNKREGA